MKVRNLFLKQEGSNQANSSKKVILRFIDAASPYFRWFQILNHQLLSLKGQHISSVRTKDKTQFKEA